VRFCRPTHQTPWLDLWNKETGEREGDKKKGKRRSVGEELAPRVQEIEASAHGRATRKHIPIRGGGIKTMLGYGV